MESKNQSKIEKDIFEWYHNSTIRNKWFHDEKCIIYLRKSKRYINGSFKECIEIASVEVFEDFRKKGIFKSLLLFIETIAKNNNQCVFIESIISDILLKYIQRIGYIPQNNYTEYFCNDYYKKFDCEL